MDYFNPTEKIWPKLNSLTLGQGWLIRGSSTDHAYHGFKLDDAPIQLAFFNLLHLSPWRNISSLVLQSGIAECVLIRLFEQLIFLAELTALTLRDIYLRENALNALGMYLIQAKQLECLTMDSLSLEDLESEMALLVFKQALKSLNVKKLYFKIFVRVNTGVLDRSC